MTRRPTGVSTSRLPPHSPSRRPSDVDAPPSPEISPRTPATGSVHATPSLDERPRRATTVSLGQPRSRTRSLPRTSCGVSTTPTSTNNPSRQRVEQRDDNDGRSTTTAAAVRAATASDAVAPLVTTKKKRVRIKTERRREQCRRNQARYRDKQRVEAIELENTVEQLRHEIARLRVQRHALHERVDTRDRATRVMLEYFRLFRYGLTVDNQVATPSSSSSSRQRNRPTLDEQLALVTTSFHENVRVDHARGRPFFLEQTRRFATLYDGLVITLDRYEVVPVDASATTITMAISLDMTISYTTLRFVFPHLLRSEHNDLRWKLLGARIRSPASSVFEFDAVGTIVGVHWMVDLVAGLLALLTLDEIAVVLHQAQIVRDAYLLHAGEEALVEEIEYETHEGEGEAADVKAANVGFIHDGQGDDYVMV